MNAGHSVFSATELKRVGTAATMMVVCGTVIILAMTILLGHYNSLAHSGPKAVLDGAVIALLIGTRWRWRCLALLGVVYGLVLLLQVGVFYLLPVMTIAGATAAMIGRVAELTSRRVAVVLAAMTYELLAGFGAPIKIYFGTDGRSEPFLWGLWFAEWPLRLMGAAVGVWLIRKWESRHIKMQTPPVRRFTRPASSRPHTRQRASNWQVAFRVFGCLIACTVPMAIQSPVILGMIALLYLAYALHAGLRRQLLHALAGLMWGGIVFATLSFAWHRDVHRVMDLGRTVVLRFMPMALASITLVATTRPIELFRFLRRLRVSAAILIPLSSVLRNIPQAHAAFRQSVETLRQQGHWTGPTSLLRRPIVILRGLLAPHFSCFAAELSEQPHAMAPPDRPL